MILKALDQGLNPGTEAVVAEPSGSSRTGEVIFEGAFSLIGEGFPL
jgi:hypothetical protein